MTLRNEWMVESGFSKRLTQCRLDKGYTRAEVAIQTNVPMTSLTYMENAYNCPSLERAVQMAKFYGCSLDWLCGLEA